MKFLIPFHFLNQNLKEQDAKRIFFIPVEYKSLKYPLFE